MSMSYLIPPNPQAMAETILAQEGDSLTTHQVRDAVAEFGWAGYGPWGDRVVEHYAAMSYDSQTGEPF